MEAGLSAAGGVSALQRKFVDCELNEMRGGKAGALITPFSSSGFDSDKRGCEALEICVLRVI